MVGLTKYGLPQIVAGAVAWISLSAVSCLLGLHWLSAAWLALFVWLLAFFRDPPRRIPQGPGLFVSPADGRITDIADIDDAEFIGGPAVRISIFLNVFNVHLNRAPCDGLVELVQHRPGRKINAMSPESGQVNESNAVGLSGTAVGKVLVRQIAGLIARRIVCEAKVGDRVERGQIFGMIKFGSRTDLVLPRRPGVLIAVKVGDKVKAGADVLARVTDVIAGRTE